MQSFRLEINGFQETNFPALYDLDKSADRIALLVKSRGGWEGRRDKFFTERRRVLELTAKAY